MWNLTEYRIAQTFMSNNDSPSTYSKNVFVPRQNRWKVSSFESKVYDRNIEPHKLAFVKNKKNYVRCLVMRSMEKPTSKSILIHIHGGGFISQSPEFHRLYLNDWAYKLKGVKIF